jgi:pimeloyl-ACP methyl ester carboxylesterase/predicted glycosyltransferase
MRALEPRISGFATATDGTRLAYEVFGSGPRTVLMLPSWQIVTSRIYKGQVPYLARYHQVVTFDPRGTGQSDRPDTGYDHDTAASDALAVMDAVGVERAAMVGFSRGAWPAVILAAECPERVERIALLGAALQEGPPPPEFWQPRDQYDGWQMRNAHAWRQDYAGWLDFFFGEVFPEPHSTKQIEDSVGWGLETTPEILIASIEQGICRTPLDNLLRRIICPVLLIHGAEDRVRPLALSEHVRDLVPQAELVVFEGAGHATLARSPVRVNLLLRDFLTDPITPLTRLPSPAHGGGAGGRGLLAHAARGSGLPAHRAESRGQSTDADGNLADGEVARPIRRWRRALTRPRRALFVSSPIGLGHVQRDVAIADALRTLVPDLQIDWLAQDPVTRVLERRGERIHPASALLANEAAHIESEASHAEHDLRVFYAWREMDEILLGNFMVLHDLVEQEPYDLWLGDEAWDVDYFLHENPELKTTPFVWLTDFVGFLPVDQAPNGREARLAADYNAEMLSQVARFPRVRDRAIFVGNPDDVVPDTFGPGLPSIRAWTERHYAFSGYVLPSEFAALSDHASLRDQHGFSSDERVVVVSVGGTSVGRHLLAKTIASFPLAKHALPELRMIVVAGPRIDPASLPQHDGLEYRGYVHDLYGMLAASDLAVVQGGLSTCMELAAAGRPFLYFPLAGHFEQRFHVPRRLDRYGAGTRLEYAETTPELLAETMVQQLRATGNAAGSGRPTRPVETDGARRAAELIAPLL